MLRSASRQAPPRIGPASADAKLALIEFLLACEDVEICAQRGLEWLARHAEVEQSLCAIVDESAMRLIGVAEHGVGAGGADEFAVDLTNRTHPLVKALSSNEPVHLVNAAQLYLLFVGASFYAVPIRRHASPTEFGIGLLLVNVDGSELPADVIWLAEVLSQHLARLRSREAVAESYYGRERTLLFGIINAVTDPILLTDPDGKLIIANTRAEKLFAAPPEASEGWRHAVTFNNMLFSAALSSSAMEDEGTARRELLLVDPIEGSDLLFELLSAPAKDHRQGTTIVSVLRNVTDLGRAREEIDENYRKLRIAQAEVRAERDRLALVIDSAADPIVVTDPAGDITMMNAPAETLFTVGSDEDDQVQRRGQANGANFSSFVSNVLFAGAEDRWQGEIGLIDPKSGTPMPVEAVSGKILSAQGELTAVVTILHDRTEALEKARLYAELERASKELEAKVQAATAELAMQNDLLRRQHIELEQASALKSQFLANMSHEFRTPLNAIMGYTQIMLHGVSGVLAPAQEKNLTRIDSNSRHLLALINDILDIERIEAGQMPVRVSEFHVAGLVQEVMTQLEPIVKRTNLTVRTEIPTRLPTLRSDRQKVKQIVVNLLTNALKFTHQGGIAITGSYNPGEATVLLAVSDTGIGIPAADQKQIFEDFRQLDSSPSRAHGGTGLGLSICKRYATMLGGWVSVKSEVGKGSTFTLHLPRRHRRR